MTDLEKPFRDLEAGDLRATLADIIFAAVLHPQDQRYEIVRRSVLDMARMQLNDGDIEAAAERARARTEFERWRDHD